MESDGEEVLRTGRLEVDGRLVNWEAVGVGKLVDEGDLEGVLKEEGPLLGPDDGKEEGAP